MNKMAEQFREPRHFRSRVLRINMNHFQPSPETQVQLKELTATWNVYAKRGKGRNQLEVFPLKSLPRYFQGLLWIQQRS